MTTSRLAPGRVVDRFRFDAVLGRGAMATVYRATHVHLGTVHAIKVLDVAQPSVHRRLLTEGRAQAQLRHPNVVAVSDVVQIDRALGLVMEFVDGPTLKHLLEHTRLTLGQAWEIGSGLLEGVRAAHEAGIVHRDLKPANILLDVSGRRAVPKITDFGLAKVLHTDLDASETRSGAAMGTPAYMAPEQVRDAKDVDHRADVFALGVILYELLAGVRPFEGDDVFAVMAAITRGEHVPLRQRRPDAPDSMIDAVEAALVVDRAARIPDVEALAAAWRAGASAALVAGGVVWPTELLAALRAAAPSTRLPELTTAVPGSGSAAATTDPEDLRAAPTYGPTDSVAPPSARRFVPWIVATAAGLIAVAAAVLLPGRDAPDPGTPDAGSPVVPPLARTVASPPEPAPPTEVAATAAPPDDVGTSEPAPAVPAAARLATARPATTPAPTAAVEPPAPAPAPVAAPVEAPPPPPAPTGPPAGKARVRVRGDKVDVWLRASHGNFLAGRDDVPAGSYAVYAFFPGDPAGTRVMTLDVDAGDERTITCDGALLRCRAD